MGWWERGEEMRVLAKDMNDPQMRAIMFKSAEGYGKLAKCVEIRTNGGRTHR